MSDMDAWLGMRPAPRPQMQGAQEGRITRISADGVWFIIPEYSAKLEFGPAPWAKARVEVASHGDGTHDHVETAPPVGARCLVLFAGAGIDRPWVVAWWP